MNDWIIERYAAEAVEKNELTSLKEKYEKLQKNYDTAIKKQYHLDYEVANQKKAIENINKTLERYERENRALRDLVSLWI